MEWIKKEGLIKSYIRKIIGDDPRKTVHDKYDCFSIIYANRDPLLDDRLTEITLWKNKDKWFLFDGYKWLGMNNGMD